MKAVMGPMALVLLGASAVLTGCAGSQPTEQWTQWTCDSQAKVLWRYAEANQSAVDVRLAGDLRVFEATAHRAVNGGDRE